MKPLDDSRLHDAVATRFYAVNGVHLMTSEDDAYATEWYLPLEVLAENEDHLPSRDVIRLAEPRLHLNDYEREMVPSGGVSAMGKFAALVHR